MDNASGRRRTSTDDKSRSDRVRVLARCIARWLRDEEANANGESVAGGFRPSRADTHLCIDCVQQDVQQRGRAAVHPRGPGPGQGQARAEPGTNS